MDSIFNIEYDKHYSNLFEIKIRISNKPYIDNEDNESREIHLIELRSLEKPSMSNYSSMLEMISNQIYKEMKLYNWNTFWMDSLTFNSPNYIKMLDEDLKEVITKLWKSLVATSSVSRFESKVYFKGDKNDNSSN